VVTMVLPRFVYFSPKTLNEAVSLSLKYGDKAKIIAGGTDVLSLMQRGALLVDYVIDISNLESLRYIRENSEGLKIGALTKLRTIENSPIVQERYTCLYEAVRKVGSMQIRNMATIGGNICRASPAGDPLLSLWTLGAKVKLHGSEGRREIPIESFILAPGRTALKTGEILTEVEIPALDENTYTAFSKIERTSQDLALLNVAVVLKLKNGICEDARIGIGAAAPTPIRAKDAENALKGKKLTDDVVSVAARIAKGEIKPITDVRASAAYRFAATEGLVKRTLKIAAMRGGIKL